MLVDIADYAFNYKIQNEKTFDTARLCMTDALACALDALDFEECTKMIGPVVPGTVVPNGARIPGTKFELDPDTATFTFGCMIRWLDYNDTFTAATSIHPSDNLAGILPLADYLSRVRLAAGKEPLVMRDVLENLIKAYEISGCLAIENGMRATGLSDHNILYRVAGCAILTRMLGGTREHVINALSNAFMDVSLTVYRHAPNTGWRKSWAAADATLQAMRIARICAKGQTGYPTGIDQADRRLLRSAVRRQAVHVFAALRRIRDQQLQFQVRCRRGPRPDRGGMRNAAARARERPHREYRSHRGAVRPRVRCTACTRPARCEIRPTASSASNTLWQSV